MACVVGTAREHLHETTMKNEDKKTMRDAIMASTIGYQVAFSPFVGLGIGYLLDSQFGTLPVLTIIFLLLGIVSGGLNYYRFAKQQQQKEEKGPRR